MFQETAERHVGGDRRVRWPDWRRSLLAIFTLALLTPGLVAGEAPSAGPELLRLVPPRACMVLTIEDFRGQYRDLMASRLIADLRTLPPVKAWFESDKFRQLQAARDQIEDALQVSLTDVRDQILGDALVFALDLPAESLKQKDAARGLLLVKAADPKLLEGLIERFNTIQKTNGEVVSIEERNHRGRTYVVRKFPEGSDRRLDAYAIFADGRFAISNSAEMIEQVLDRASADGPRQAGPEGSLAERFLATQRRLPERALARLFIDPATLLGLVPKEADASSPGQSLVVEHLGSLESIGAALVVSDRRITLEGVEVFKHCQAADNPGKNADAITSATFDRLPDATLGAASLRVDLPALYRSVVGLVPEKDRARMESLELVFKGILLGLDLRTVILPSLGPRIGAILETPTEWKAVPDDAKSAIPGGGFPFPVVLTVDLSKQPGSAQVAAALDNALTTLLAVMTLDERHRGTPFRVVTREFQGHAIRTLDPTVPFAFTIDPQEHRLILANSSGSVERYFAATPGRAVTTRWKGLAEKAFPGAGSFACLDVAAVRAMLHTQRDRIAEQIAGREHRPQADVARDLDNAEALAQVFDAAFWTHRVDQASGTDFHTLGLLVRPSNQPANPPAAP